MPRKALQRETASQQKSKQWTAKNRKEEPQNKGLLDLKRTQNVFWLKETPEDLECINVNIIH